MMKDRLKNYGLWVAVFSLIALICESYGLNILPPNYDEITTAILGICVMLGIVNNPTTESRWYLDDKNKKK